MAICSHLMPSLIDVLHRCTQSEKIFRSTASLRQPPPLNQTIPSRAADFAGHFFFMCIIQAHTHTHVSPLSFYKLFFFLYEHDQEKWLTTMIRKFSGSLDHLSFFVLRPHNIFPTQMGTLVICHVSIFRPNGSSSLSFCSCMSMTKKVQICCRCASGTKGNPLHDRIIPLILLHTDNSSPVLLLT